MKGYGLRALQDLPAGAFIYEYVGEVGDDDDKRLAGVCRMLEILEDGMSGLDMQFCGR